LEVIKGKKFTQNQFLKDSKLMYSVFELINDFLPAILQFYKGGISLKDISAIGYTDAIKILPVPLPNSILKGIKGEYPLFDKKEYNNQNWFDDYVKEEEK
jgi:hypothetical protein